MSNPARRADALLKALRERQDVLILTHDNPDPDAIAAALALQRIVQASLKHHATIAYGGIIGRAENKALVELLGVELVAASDIDFDQYNAVALVDTQPGAGNDSLPAGLLPVALIDHHHPRQAATDGVPFVDLRPEYGACSTMLVEYLRALSIPIDRRLATALFYGIKVDTQDLGRNASTPDIDAYLHLFPLADKLLMPKIQYPALPREYFETFHQALERAMVHGSVAVAALDDLENPNAVAEVAELLLRLEGATWSACLGYFGGQLFVSLRTSDIEANAHDVVCEAIGSLGSGGGHGMLAGGRIWLARANHRQRDAVRANIVGRILEALGAIPDGIPLLRPKARQLGDRRWS